MSDPMTEAQFAQQVAYLAKSCAGWSADMLGPNGEPRYTAPVDPNTVDRFLAEIQERCDRIRAWAHGGHDAGIPGHAPEPEPEAFLQTPPEQMPADR